MFRPALRVTVRRRLKIVDLPARIAGSLPAMALNAPYLPPNPNRPRAFGGKGWKRKFLAIPGNSYE